MKTQLAIVNQAFDSPVVCMPDNSLMGLQLGQEKNVQDVRSLYSRDNGRTWTEQIVLFKLPMEPGWWLGFELLLDRDGELHCFMLNDAHTGVCWAGEGERPGIGGTDTLRLDIWHAKTTNGRKTWLAPHKIWEGYTGALNSVIQLKNGRILLPFSYLTKRNWFQRGGGLGEWTFMGQFDSIVSYSDDSGATWRLGNALKVMVPDISYAYGACEPVVLELKDGRVWMLIRAQIGRFYESYSSDGAQWSIPRPSQILSSDSPAGLVRLKDGRIALIWNNCLRYPYAYGGRQVIHAALSEDEGQTWYGYREVFRDPLRNEPPPKGGDFGTAYPFPTVAPDGNILLMTGQGKGRRHLVLLDPAYLEARTQCWDASQGLETWGVFGTQGVGLEPESDGSQHQALGLRKLNAEFPAAAVWNFPSGAKGCLKLHIYLKPGFKGCRIALTDHFSVPYDDQDIFFNLWNMAVDSEGRLMEGGRLQTGRWYNLELRWDCAARRCRIMLDGVKVGIIPLLRESRNVCYLRLQAKDDIRDGGFMVDAVSVRCAHGVQIRKERCS